MTRLLVMLLTKVLSSQARTCPGSWVEDLLDTNSPKYVEVPISDEEKEFCQGEFVYELTGGERYCFSKSQDPNEGRTAHLKCQMDDTVTTTTTTTTTTTETSTTSECITEKGPCIFPFKYEGKIFTACTAYKSEGGAHWCATEVDAEGEVVTGKWADCPEDCPREGNLLQKCRTENGKSC